MFDTVTLLITEEITNKNGEAIEQETPLDVAIVLQNVDRAQRDKYHQEGLGRAVRFKVALFGDAYNASQIPYFIYKGVRYSVRDFTMDKTQSACYIEGTSNRGA